MMFEHHESVDGITYAIQEIDQQQLSELAPQYSRNLFREVIRAQVDELLDQRNDLRSILGELALDELEKLMQE